MFILYKITSETTGKVYIGYTSKRLKDRWWQHKKDANGNVKKYKLQNAMRKYGTQDFCIERLEYVDTLDKALKRETELIGQHNSYHKGYNSTLGGELPTNGMKGK